MADDAIRAVQLKNGAEGISLIAGGSEIRPKHIDPGSGEWQRWAIETLGNLMANNQFYKRGVVAAMPPGALFIDHVKMPDAKGEKQLQQEILSKIESRLPFSSDDLMLKYIKCDDNNLLVMASQRQNIDRYLAIYEQADIHIKAIEVWPVAMANTYTRFFGRRRSDLDAVVMLLDIRPQMANVVICRAKNVLFAHSIQTGFDKLENKGIKNLVLELKGCRRRFETIYKKVRIDRLIFLSGKSMQSEVCHAIAEQMQMPAQIGDCLAAVKMSNPGGVEHEFGIERRVGALTSEKAGRKNIQSGWAVAFGLSLEN